MSENVEPLEVSCQEIIVSKNKELIRSMDYTINVSDNLEENGPDKAENNMCKSKESNICDKEEDSGYSNHEKNSSQSKENKFTHDARNNPENKENVGPIDIDDEWFENFIVDVNLELSDVDISDIEREILIELAKFEKNYVEVEGRSSEVNNEVGNINEVNGVTNAEKNISEYEEDSDASESESEEDNGQSDYENVNIFDHKPFSRMSKRELNSHLSALKAYRDKKSLDTLYPCLKCDKLFAFECDLDSHSETCQGLIGKRVQVEIDHPSLDLGRVRYRVQGSWGKYKSVYRCELCPYKTTVQRNMQQHFYVHSGQKPYRCKECGKSFNTANYLTKHKRCHEGFYPYKCKKCDYATFRASNLKRHEDEVHGDDAVLYACVQCDYKTVNPSALTRHSRAHANDCRHRCSRCPFSAVTARELKIHRLQHTRHKPFVCERCNLGYTNKANLNRHVSSRHPEGADNVPKAKRRSPNPKSKLRCCEHCEHFFTSKRNLKRHARFHTELRSEAKEGAKISNIQ